PDTPILDIGCGSGAWLQRLADRGFQNLWGIDQDIEQFRASGAHVHQVNLDMDNLDLPIQHFGLITAIEVIEHLENPGRLFYHASRYLDPHGYLLITTPNIHSVGCRLRFLLTGQLKSFDAKGDPTHIYPVLLTALNRVLPRYGLKIVKKWGYPARGSLVSRPSTLLLSTIAEWFLPNSDPGDTLCLLIRSTTSA
ncbi:MAG: class I SAM-dependent methyltransferase, partial [Cyanobacteria bacterium]|nr:class I SAM-dependent methyltransferase [Cyanobacteriota bacterium]MDW8203296.1 class I SAM-dependent methyltransferase [Cyanobacteriota bacterium SKYGB_h_bin112]